MAETRDMSASRVGPLVAIEHGMRCHELVIASLFVLVAACGIGSVTGGEVDAGTLDPQPDSGSDADIDEVDLSFDYDTTGRWLMPPWLVAQAQSYSVGYDGPPPWDDGANCGGSFLVGTQALGNRLLALFSQISDLGGYSCRANTANMSETSVHGTGRAIDVFIPEIAGQADNLRGDLVANWLVYHAEELGVQLVIWDRSQWIGVGADKHDSYGGPVPHSDHLHVELTLEAAELE